MLTKNQFTKDFKKIMIDNDLTQDKLAQMLCKSKGTLSPQINGATFRYVDFVNILDMLGYDVIWVKRNGHNAISENDWGTKNPNDEKA